VAGGVDQVDLDRLFRNRVEVVNRDVFREDGDAALAFERVAVEHRVLYLVVAEVAGLAQEGVDQRRFPMVDVGDDGDVSNVVTHVIHYCRSCCPRSAKSCKIGFRLHLRQNIRNRLTCGGV
jgi:hypothetical protein